MEPEVVDLQSESKKRRSLTGRLWREVSGHPMAYGVTLAFTVAGGVLAPWLFPEVSPLVGVLVGLAFGVYAALSAVPDKFLG